MHYLELITIILVILKLTHQLYWSWWIVLAPAWIPFAIALYRKLMRRLQ